MHEPEASAAERTSSTSGAPGMSSAGGWHLADRAGAQRRLVHVSPSLLQVGTILRPGRDIAATVTHCSCGVRVSLTDPTHSRLWAGYLAERGPARTLHVYDVQPLGPVYRPDPRRGVPDWPTFETPAGRVLALVDTLEPWATRSEHDWARRAAIPF